MKKIPFIFAILLTLNVTLITHYTFSQTLQWVKTIGGPAPDIGYSIAVDASGNVYTTGTFKGTVDFDPGAGVHTLTSLIDENNIFISKLDASGNFLWAKAIVNTTSGGNYGISITTDTFGNVYTAGCFYGPADFDPGAGTANLISAGNCDIFILKLDGSGNFLWAKTMGSVDGDVSTGITIDVSGNVYTTGYFTGTVDFDPGVGVYALTSEAVSLNFNMFISKLDSSGNFIWAKAFKGLNNVVGQSITTDASGNIYTTGNFSGDIDFDPGMGTVNLTSAGNYDVFTSKLDASGDLLWAKTWGGAGSECGYSLIDDANGNIYITGMYSATVDFDPGVGTVNLTSAGSYDIFISKLDSSGNFLWAKAMGGVGSDRGSSISIGQDDNVYSTGYFTGTADFNPGVGVDTLTLGNGGAIFISKLDGSGNFQWAKAMGSVDSSIYLNMGFGITTDVYGNVYTTGYYSGTGYFGVGGAVDTLISAGIDDIFVLKIADNETSIQQLTNNNSKITIYPNPAASSITISVNNVKSRISIKLYGILGNLVLEHLSQQPQQSTLDISQLPKGVYSLVTESMDGRTFNKVIIH